MNRIYQYFPHLPVYNNLLFCISNSSFILTIYKLYINPPVKDKKGNKIYITDERWEHIYKRHPEVIGFENLVLITIRLGNRKQLLLEPDVFRYSKSFTDLPDNHLQIIVVVKFSQKLNKKDQLVTNNFVITAYMK